MKNTLLALALFAFAGTTAFAHEGHDKDGKKDGKKEACTAKAGAAGASCCMHKGATKTAAVKPVVKAPATAKM